MPLEPVLSQVDLEGMHDVRQPIFCSGMRAIVDICLDFICLLLIEMRFEIDGNAVVERPGRKEDFHMTDGNLSQDAFGL